MKSMFKCIISHSPKKLLLPPLHKFTVRYLDLIFSFFGKLNSLNIALYFTDLSIFQEDGKKLDPQESSITFCRLFMVRVKNVCYERKVRGKLLGSFFHCKMEWLRLQVPNTSFRLMALRNSAECQYYNETNIPPC